MQNLGGQAKSINVFSKVAHGLYAHLPKEHCLGCGGVYWKIRIGNEGLRMWDRGLIIYNNNNNEKKKKKTKKKKKKKKKRKNKEKVGIPRNS